MRMERLAGRIMLLWGARRHALALTAGAVGALALPPFGIFGALFVSFTLLVWLPAILRAPKERLNWTAFFISWIIGAAAWIVAQNLWRRKFHDDRARRFS